MNCIYSSIPAKLTDGLDSSLSKKEFCGDMLGQATGGYCGGSGSGSEAGSEYIEVAYKKIQGLQGQRDVKVNANAMKVYRALRCDLSGNRENDKPVKYDGVTYRNPFRVTGGPIYLVGVEFFGPGRVARAQYKVNVRVERPSWTVKLPWHYLFTSCWYQPDEAELYGEVTRKVSTTKQEMWQVFFDHPIYVPPEKWIEINFHIMEGDTELSRMKQADHNLDAKIHTHDGIRQFHFHSGSCQMPAIAFIVDPIKLEQL